MFNGCNSSFIIFYAPSIVPARYWDQNRAQLQGSGSKPFTDRFLHTLYAMLSPPCRSNMKFSTVSFIMHNFQFSSTCFFLLIC